MWSAGASFLCRPFPSSICMPFPCLPQLPSAYRTSLFTHGSSLGLFSFLLSSLVVCNQCMDIFLKCAKQREMWRSGKKLSLVQPPQRQLLFWYFLKYCINMCDVFTRIIPPWICTTVLSVVILGGGVMVLTFIFIPLYNVGKNMHIYWLKIRGKQ